MRKTSTLLAFITLLPIFSNAFATIKLLGGIPEQHYNGRTYEGIILSADYVSNLNGNQQIVIMTATNKKLDESGLKDQSIVIDGKDLPFGQTLVSAIGKEIALSFSNANFDITAVGIANHKSTCSMD